MLMPFDWTKFAEGAATQGVGSVLGFVNGLINQSYNRANMATQQAYAQQNMQLSNQLNKEFQDFVWKNEIPANVQAMKRAGLNPAGSNTSLSGAGNVSNALSSFAPSSVAPQFDLLTGGRGLSDMAKAIAEAKKVGVETTQAEKMFDDMLKNLQEDVRSKELGNNLTAIYGNREREYQLGYLDRQIMKTAYEIDNLIKQGNFVEAERKLRDQQHETEKYRTSQEKDRAEMAMPLLWRDYNESISRERANNASASASYASAKASNAQAAKTTEETKQLIDMHDDIVKFQQYTTDEKFAQSEVAARTIDAQINNLRGVSCHTYWQTQVLQNHVDELKQQVENMKEAKKLQHKQNQSYWFDKAITTLAIINNEANKWAPWAFSRDTQVEDNKGNVTISSTHSYSPWSKH